MPMGKRIPQTAAWRNICIQRMASIGAFACSSEISSWCAWARTRLRDARSTTAVLRKRCAIGRSRCMRGTERRTPKTVMPHLVADARHVAASVHSPVCPTARIHSPSRNELVSLRLDVHLVRHRTHNCPQL